MEESAASTSLRVDEPVRRAAFGPPAQAVSKGPRSGKGVQKVGNGAFGEWKNETPRARFSQKAVWKRIATRITGPSASLRSARRFSGKRKGPDCSTPSGNVTMTRGALAL